MRLAVTLALAMALPCCAVAQDTATSAKSVRTQKITQSPLPDPMIATDYDGRLLIDWAMAEQIATSPTDAKRAALARLMLAIRDGQWKPMPPRL